MPFGISEEVLKGPYTFVPQPYQLEALAMRRRIVRPENKGTKPHIRPGNDNRWLCVGHGAYGYGRTQFEAYDQWEESRMRVLRPQPAWWTGERPANWPADWPFGPSK